MKFNIFLWMVLALLTAGIAARTHSRAAHMTTVSELDQDFLKVDREIRAKYKKNIGSVYKI